MNVCVPLICRLKPYPPMGWHVEVGPMEVIRVHEIIRVGPCDEISTQVRRGGHTTLGLREGGCLQGRGFSPGTESTSTLVLHLCLQNCEKSEYAV